MLRRGFIATAVSLVAVALFVVSPLRSTGAQQSKQLAAADEIVRLRTEWGKNLHAKQLDQLVALYAPDAVYLKPSGARVTGRPAIRDVCKKILDSFSSEISFQSLGSGHSGDLAYDSGEYRESLVKVSDQTKAEAQGNYMMIFKRQPDGRWLIAEQMWTLVTPGTE